MDKLRQHLESQQYLCPFPECDGTITVTQEGDEGGIWNVFAGECGSDFEESEDVCAGSGQRPYYVTFEVYRNHADLLNGYEENSWPLDTLLTRVDERRIALRILNEGAQHG